MAGRGGDGDVWRQVLQSRRQECFFGARKAEGGLSAAADWNAASRAGYWLSIGRCDSAYAGWASLMQGRGMMAIRYQLPLYAHFLAVYAFYVEQVYGELEVNVRWCDVQEKERWLDGARG